MKRPKTILVIDDDREITRLIEETLEREFRVLTASSAEEGMRMLEQKPVSLVILDYLLPDMDGVEALRKIREEYPMPIIMITAFGNKDVVLKSWKYRADFYFDKPFVFRELREKVRDLLGDVRPFGIIGIDPSAVSADTRAAIEFIWKNVAGPDGDPRRLNRDQISSERGLSPNYISALFKRECGMSIFDCINIVRIERAKELLSDGGCDIKEVSTRLGFDHPNNFSRFFRKMTGRTPSFHKK